MDAAPIAAPPQAPPAPPPAQVRTEARIDQNPGQAPAPIGSQAPPKVQAPQTEPQRAQSRREVIERQYAKIASRQTPPAQAKIGHNQPPEPTPADRPRQEAASAPFDLRRPPPKERRNQQQQDRPRGEHGHFAPNGQGQQGQGQPRLGMPQLPANAPFREAPGRMHEQARRDWAAAPVSVRGEVHRLHTEFTKAYQQLRDDHLAFDPIRQYHQLAQSQGTTLDRALYNYVTMEHLLRSNPLQGLETLVRNMNLRTQDGHQLTLYDIAYYIATQSPQELQARQQKHDQASSNHQIQTLQNSVGMLADTVQRMHNAQAYSQQYFHTRRAVDRFAETHPRLEELGQVIAAELNAGYDLPTAYRRAELLHPAGNAPAAQTRTNYPAAQTRAQADRSITGAPGGNGSAQHNTRGIRRNGKAPPQRRDIIANAIRRVNGAL